MCNRQRLRKACAYAQSDQSFCQSLEYSMNFKLLTEKHFGCLFLTGSCTGSSESKPVKMPHCWKSHVTAYFSFAFNRACVRIHGLSRACMSDSLSLIAAVLFNRVSIFPRVLYFKFLATSLIESYYMYNPILL